MKNTAKASKLPHIYSSLTASDREKIEKSLHFLANRLLATLKKERKKYKNKITYPVNPCATVDFPKSLKTTYTCMIYEDNARKTVS